MTLKDKISLVNKLRQRVNTVERELKATTYLSWRNAKEVLEDEMKATNNQSLKHLINC